jgi:aspartyl-tRNA(Asn)/glutamyl-tRNA(Gln) amidotransferase subunit B
VLENGGSIVQETRGWDDDQQKGFSMRTKENADDYRYMPDPDIPPIELSEDFVKAIKASMPDLPEDYRRVLSDLGIEQKVIEDIIAVPETARTVKRIFETSNAELARRVAFWMMQPQSEDEIADSAADVEVPDKYLVTLAQMVQDNKLSSTAAKDVFARMMRSGGEPAALAEEMNLLQVSDEGAIAEIVAKVLAENEKAAEDVRNGEMKAIGFLVGQVMKASQGKANPALAQSLIRKQLGL